MLINLMPRTSCARAIAFSISTSFKPNCPSQNAQVRNAVEYEGTPVDAAAPEACKAVRRSTRLTFLPDSDAS